MTSKRKKWQPEYRFGGNPADVYRPNVLGENQVAHRLPKTKKPKRKK